MITRYLVTFGFIGIGILTITGAAVNLQHLVGLLWVNLGLIRLIMVER